MGIGGLIVKGISPKGDSGKEETGFHGGSQDAFQTDD
jgi:hypothetical protein